ncbi:polysaccharide deacetylase family protein [Ekhidna sp.]
MRILTFDLEEWFHILDVDASRDINNWHSFEKRVEYNTEVLREVLNQYNIKATFFCLGWVAEKYPELIKKLHKDGHDIGSHGYYHQLVYKQSKEEFYDDLTKSLDVLENIIGNKVTMYRAPGFSINSESLWAFDTLMECGIKVDCSLRPSILAKEFEGFDPNNFNGIYYLNHKGQKLDLLYVNSLRFLNKELFLSGGGYFRLLPTEIFKRWTNNSQYFMTYFHPRDFDPDQRTLPGLSAMRRFKSYYGLASSLDKLKKVLGQFEFTSISNVLERQEIIEQKELTLKGSEELFTTLARAQA